VSEYYDGGDNYGDGEEIRAEFTDGSSLTFVDVDGDGYADKVIYDGGYEEYDAGHDAGYDAGHDAGHEPAYTEEPTGDEGTGYYDTGYADGGSFYANDNLDTAVSTNPGGDEGYIALGDGEFVSWG
jgi:hypothetical protein